MSWGPNGEIDDPRLDLDDVNGFGPENINIEEPEVPQDYLVGVYYYLASGSGNERVRCLSPRRGSSRRQPGSPAEPLALRC